MGVREQARAGARRAGGSPVVENGARVGYAASGVLHLLLAWLALRITWGAYRGEADQSGAFGALAATPAGRVVLGVVGAGLVLLALWNLTEAILVRGDAGRLVKAAAKTVTYAVLAWGAIGFTVGIHQKSSAQQTKDVTASLMAKTWGTVLLVVIGLVVVGIGVGMAYKGIAHKYREDLREDPGTGVEVAATFGYVAKGVSLLIVGVLFWVAVATNDPQKATGLDGALRALLHLPLGKLLLTIVALGLVAYAIYSFARAKYARV